jgi:hypothetical protein
MIDRTRSLCGALDFIGKPGKVFVQSIEYFALGLVCGEIADQRGLGSVASQFLDGRLIILHGRPLAAAP